MRSRRRLAAAPLSLLVLVLAACSSGSDGDTLDSAPTIPGRGGTELPSADDQRAALESSGDAVFVLSAEISPDAPESVKVEEAPAGTHVVRVACTSSDGAPLTITVSAGGQDLTSYQAACVPVFQGGATIADSDPFELPGGAVDVNVVAAAESVAAVGLAASEVPAGEAPEGDAAEG
ncbi:hypothetical protein Cfla_2948 [Cellulomonas flavigena DSM 20109]|uniref:Lipoprotein n=1 Tax=Cellulomonas flavigena (strain ATCC 482 / DSM 20109 / BCRC 11376 / JCM 18109 / NBRC 3775 / NCIMB 8073 / NRS 134) TaxID=446466 RepID=D5UKH0_CELFN|nr:hypothetical protein [Cellulomonas flavigena]ADG75831.1 hypothetical protein Cfla_2948 [Cellulomonas flavigena DSM 20109]